MKVKDHKGNIIPQMVWQLWWIGLVSQSMLQWTRDTTGIVRLA
jgi:hypothetical protein